MAVSDSIKGQNLLPSEETAMLGERIKSTISALERYRADRPDTSPSGKLDDAQLFEAARRYAEAKRAYKELSARASGEASIDWADVEVALNAWDADVVKNWRATRSHELSKSPWVPEGRYLTMAIAGATIAYLLSNKAQNAAISAVLGAALAPLIAKLGGAKENNEPEQLELPMD